jgi:hypothetical protein
MFKATKFQITFHILQNKQKVFSHHIPVVAGTESSIIVELMDAFGNFAMVDKGNAQAGLD